jgi:glycine cleavage system transcriptional repressor
MQVRAPERVSMPRGKLAPVRHFALSAVGRDQPGIVAAVSEVLLTHGINIEDSQMTILRGHFTMVLVLAAADDVDAAALDAGLAEARRQLGLEALSLSELEETGIPAEAAPSHIVTVYGADHPGIVHAVAAALAERGVNITDLYTRLAGEGEDEMPLYALMMEIELPADLVIEEVERTLRDVADEQRLELSVRALERDTL